MIEKSNIFDASTEQSCPKVEIENLGESSTCMISSDGTAHEEYTYPKDFFALFGSGKELGLDEEPEELSFSSDCVMEEL